MVLLVMVLKMSYFHNKNFLIMVRALLIISGSNDNGYNSSSANTVVLVIIVHCDRDYSDND